MSFLIRPARQSDRWTIRLIVWRARINPFDLAWQRFLVAEENGKLIGVGQIKPHADGSRELASIAVTLSHQHKGVASMLILALLANEQGLVYLTCRAPLELFYARFGFRRATELELPPYFRRIARWSQVFRQPVLVMVRVPD